MAPYLTCRMLAQRDAGAAPAWDNILRTAYWDLVHSYNTSLPGWMVLVVRRHIETMADLTGAASTSSAFLASRRMNASARPNWSESQARCGHIWRIGLLMTRIERILADNINCRSAHIHLTRAISSLSLLPWKDSP